MGERSWSWADIQAAHANTRLTAVIQLDTVTVAEHDRLRDRLSRLEDEDATGLVDHAEEITALKDQIRDLIKKAEENELVVTFQGVGRSRYNKLRAEHPAVDGQAVDDLYGENPGFNFETFVPALMAEACIAPESLAGNVEAWTHIHETWDRGPVTLLWTRCWAAQQAVQTTPKLSAVSGRRKGSNSERS
jgi:hypothetical protein